MRYASTKDVIIRFRVTQAMADKLNRYADKEDLTLSEICRREIGRYLLRESRK